MRHAIEARKATCISCKGIEAHSGAVQGENLTFLTDRNVRKESMGDSTNVGSHVANTSGGDGAHLTFAEPALMSYFKVAHGSGGDGAHLTSGGSTLMLCFGVADESGRDGENFTTVGFALMSYFGVVDESVVDGENFTWDGYVEMSCSGGLWRIP